MTQKQYHSDRDIRSWTHAIMRQMEQDHWRPDYIVGITRGGLIPAVMFSQYMNVPMHTLKVSLRDGDGPESNLWMAEDAFGYVPYETGLERDRPVSDPARRKNILIVDDINDTGATLDWIMEDWSSGCLPDHPAWKDVWHNNVRFAVMVDNLSSKFKSQVDYSGKEINKAENDVWIVFPWESWWEK